MMIPSRVPVRTTSFTSMQDRGCPPRCERKSTYVRTAPPSPPPPRPFAVHSHRETDGRAGRGGRAQSTTHRNPIPPSVSCPPAEKGRGGGQVFFLFFTAPISYSHTCISLSLSLSLSLSSRESGVPFRRRPPDAIHCARPRDQSLARRLPRRGATRTCYFCARLFEKRSSSFFLLSLDLWCKNYHRTLEIYILESLLLFF
mmetsp:Transcript_6759/g.20049  ORF Transcript_6759/g.20049 Transcript_6759/m.20049 type:complete len:200 (+) Transcript_6759:173-772(+)